VADAGHPPLRSRVLTKPLSWESYWHAVLDTSHPPFWKWFAGGRLNACHNCVDRHLAARPNQAALIWVPELPVTMLACARLGAIHSQVFGGFSGAACGDRIADSGGRILVTMDAYTATGS
jgi:acetyl-CoA synthetase